MISKTLPSSVKSKISINRLLSAAASRSRRSLADLPDVVLIEICRNLPVASRMRLRRVNSRFTNKIVSQSMHRLDLEGEFGLLAYAFGEKAPLAGASIKQTAFMDVVRQAAPPVIRLAGCNLAAANFYYSRSGDHQHHSQWCYDLHLSEEVSSVKSLLFELLMTHCPNLRSLELDIDMSSGSIAGQLSSAFAKLTCLKVDQFEATLIEYFPSLQRLSVATFELPPKNHALDANVILNYEKLDEIEIRSEITRLHLDGHPAFFFSIAAKLTVCDLLVCHPDERSPDHCYVDFLDQTKNLRRLTLRGKFFLPAVAARWRRAFDVSMTDLSDLSLYGVSPNQDYEVLSSSLLGRIKVIKAERYLFHDCKFVAGCEKLERCWLSSADDLQLHPSAPLTHLLVWPKYNIRNDETFFKSLTMSRHYPLQVCHFDKQSFSCDEVCLFLKRHRRTLRELSLGTLVDLEPEFFRHKSFIPNLQLAPGSPKSGLMKLVVIDALYVKKSVSISDMQIAINDFVEARACWMTEQMTRFGEYSRGELSLVLNLPGVFLVKGCSMRVRVPNGFLFLTDKKLNSAGIVLVRKHTI